MREREGDGTRGERVVSFRDSEKLAELVVGQVAFNFFHFSGDVFAQLVGAVDIFPEDACARLFVEGSATDVVGALGISYVGIFAVFVSDEATIFVSFFDGDSGVFGPLDVVTIAKEFVGSVFEKKGSFKDRLIRRGQKK